MRSSASFPRQTSRRRVPPAAAHSQWKAHLIGGGAGFLEARPGAVAGPAAGPSSAPPLRRCPGMGGGMGGGLFWLPAAAAGWGPGWGTGWSSFRSSVLGFAKKASSRARDSRGIGALLCPRHATPVLAQALAESRPPNPSDASAGAAASSSWEAAEALRRTWPIGVNSVRPTKSEWGRPRKASMSRTVARRCCMAASNQSTKTCPLGKCSSTTESWRAYSPCSSICPSKPP
mmetsp:Transcript_24124/g.54445  ORF Transcript_24124/g.54445 Transcript_24124/m.54445 type:complete len:231 (-) Transcript_24124:1389-2081(-)